MKSRFLGIKVLCYVVMVFSVTPVLADVLYVAPEGNDGQDGTSWLTAKRTISAALSAASEGDQIWVKHGTYTERIVLKGGVDLYGGFVGVESNLSQRPAFPRPSPDPYETVIDGDNGGSVVESPAEAAAPHRLDGFTLRNGLADYGGGLIVRSPENALTVVHCTITNNRARRIGGGVCCFNTNSPSSPTFLNCTIQGNTSDNIAGGLYAASSVFLQNCLITDNFATQRGGGLFFSSPRPTLDDCLIARNRAGYAGGGIYCISAVFVARDCTFQNNEAGEPGGGIYAIWSSPILSNCLVEDNRAEFGGGAYLEGFYGRLEECRIVKNTAWSGGGMVLGGGGGSITDCTIELNNAEYSAGVSVHSNAAVFTRCTITKNNASTTCGGVSFTEASTAQLVECVISENKATWAGGIFVYLDCAPVITQCTIARNQAIYGGGLYHHLNRTSIPIVSSCVFAANTADYGGAVVYYDSAGDMINCSITGNVASVAGGAVWANSAYRAMNTLIAYNSSGVYHESGPAPAEFRHNCVWGNSLYNYGGSMSDLTGIDGNISLDPRLAAAHLLPDSPCIDAGDSAAASGIARDYDGEERIAGNAVDIGADEFSPPIVQGQILLNDYSGNLPLFVDMEIRQSGERASRSVLLDTNGTFVLPSAPEHEFILSLKPARFLRRSLPVDTSTGNVVGIEIELTNGDIDGDNEVTLFDFGALVAAFGSIPGDSNWNPEADLDGDEEVTLFDFGILVRNFGKVGDD